MVSVTFCAALIDPFTTARKAMSSGHSVSSEASALQALLEETEAFRTQIYDGKISKMLPLGSIFSNCSYSSIACVKSALMWLGTLCWRVRKLESRVMTVAVTG